MVCKTSIQGFTLVEVTVSIAIIVLFASISASQFVNYSSNVYTNLAAEDLSIGTREVQSYALNVTSALDGTSVVRPTQFGIEFIKDESLVFEFADTNPQDGVYSGTAACDTECIRKIELTAQTYVKDICVGDSVSGETCGYPTLSVVYARPRGVVHIYDHLGNEITGKEYALITISNNRGDTSIVRIGTGGYVATE